MIRISNIISWQKSANKATMFILLIFFILAGGITIRSSAHAQSTDPAVVGQWSGIIEWPQVTVHAHVLPTGQVLTWAGPHDDDPRIGEGPRRPYLWNPTTGVFTEAPLVDLNIFCSGHSFMDDGRLFVAGGGLSDDIGGGEANGAVYDPWNNLWVSVPPMNMERYYPTNTTLPNGHILTISGSYEGVRNKLPQVFNSTTWTWSNLTNARLSLPLYPMMFVAPNGKVFFAGPYKETRYLDVTGKGLWTAMPKRKGGTAIEGSAVMYDVGKVLVAGGRTAPNSTKPKVFATAEVIDLNAASPSWRLVSPMSRPRQHMNLTLLPDGKVLVTGGTSGLENNDPTNSDCGQVPDAVCFTELWDPVTEKFTVLSSMTKPRMYHSVAVLLPDARVLVAGGNFHSSAEVYSPPYLFKGARPLITSAPASVTYGQSFFVGVQNPTEITKVTWIRLSSVTHSFNENQRINHLSYSQAAGGLNVTAPSNRNICPPGHYMLFVLNGNGVPSEAKIIQII